MGQTVVAKMMTPVSMDCLYRRPARLPHRTPKDDRLEELVTAASGTEIDWDHISGVLANGRTGSQCCSRWQKVLHPQTIKGAWTTEVGVVVHVIG